MIMGLKKKKQQQQQQQQQKKKKKKKKKKKMDVNECRNIFQSMLFCF